MAKNHVGQASPTLNPKSLFILPHQQVTSHLYG